MATAQGERHTRLRVPLGPFSPIFWDFATWSFMKGLGREKRTCSMTALSVGLSDLVGGELWDRKEANFPGWPQGPPRSTTTKTKTTTLTTNKPQNMLKES
jgi:hypothetical protein